MLGRNMFQDPNIAIDNQLMVLNDQCVQWSVHTKHFFVSEGQGSGLTLIL